MAKWKGRLQARVKAETAEDMRAAVDQVQEALRAAGVETRVSDITRVCDGCGIAAPTLDLPEDWKHVDGEDFCAMCIETGRVANA